MKHMRVNLGAVTLLVCLAIIIPLGLTLKFHYQLPFSDAWDDNIVMYLQHSQHNLNLSSWFAFHNEHRLLLTRLVYALNYSLLPQAPSFTNLVSYLAILLSFMLLTRLAITSSTQLKLRQASPWFIVLLATCFFLPSNITYYSWSFLIQFPLLALFSIASVLCANRSNIAWSRLIACCILSTAATASSANGLALWAIVFIQLWLMHTSKIKLAVYAVAGITVICFYLHGSPATHVVFSQPLHSLLYFIKFLGNPTAFHLGTVVPIIMGVAALILYCHCLWLIFRHVKQHHRATYYPWVALIAFTIINALTGSFTRVVYGSNQALSWRYALISSLALVALTVCYRLLIHQQQVSKAWQRSLLAIMSLYLIITATGFISIAQVGVTHNYRYSASEIALPYKVFLPTAHDLYPPGNQAIGDRLLPYMQSRLYSLGHATPNYLLKTLTPSALKNLGKTFSKQSVQLTIGKTPNVHQYVSGMLLGKKISGIINTSVIKRKKKLSDAALLLNKNHTVIGIVFTPMPLRRTRNPALKLYGFQLAHEKIDQVLWLYQAYRVRQLLTPQQH